MSTKVKIARPSRTEIQDTLIGLDMEGKIDLSKVYNGLHFERIIDYICTESKSPFFTLEELLEPDSVERMIKSRHYNWTRPEGAINFDAWTFNFQTITEQERNKLLDLPKDELTNMINQYIQCRYFLRMSPKTFLKLAEFLTEQFANEQIYDKCLWDMSFVKSIANTIEVQDD